MNQNAKADEIEKLLKENQNLIDKKIWSIALFGYPIVFVPEEFWEKNSNSKGFHSSFGLVAIKNDSDLSLEGLKAVLIHELVHAINKYKIENLNSKIVEKGITWYEAVETFDPKARESVRNFYKIRIFKIFREEIQTYYTQGLWGNNLDEMFDKTTFMYAYGQINSTYSDDNEISLPNIQKYDPEFALELKRTFAFWKLVLSKSLPTEIEKIIHFVQSKSSFEEISINNLQKIREEIKISPFTIK